MCSSLSSAFGHHRRDVLASFVPPDALYYTRSLFQNAVENVSKWEEIVRDCRAKGLKRSKSSPDIKEISKSRRSKGANVNTCDATNNKVRAERIMTAWNHLLASRLQKGDCERHNIDKKGAKDARKKHGTLHICNLLCKKKTSCTQKNTERANVHSKISNAVDWMKTEMA